VPTKKGKDARPGKTARAPRGDDPGSRGDRSKRLLDLVMILLRARMPVTYRDIREQFPAYQTLNSEAGLRAFERDKADLLDLGVPIRYITPDEDDSLEDGGYVIDLKRFKMPEVRLTPDEISALVLAAAVAHAMPGGAYPKIVDLALKKLAFDLPELPDTPTEFPRPAPVLVHFPERRSAAAGARADLAEI
jgi:proteasome accessory factor B